MPEGRKVAEERPSNDGRIEKGDTLHGYSAAEGDAIDIVPGDRVTTDGRAEGQFDEQRVAGPAPTLNIGTQVRHAVQRDLEAAPRRLLAPADRWPDRRLQHNVVAEQPKQPIEPFARTIPDFGKAAGPGRERPLLAGSDVQDNATISFIFSTIDRAIFGRDMLSVMIRFSLARDAIEGRERAHAAAALAKQPK
nr:hypothetical protein [Bradyrhizobium oropedii]